MKVSDTLRMTNPDLQIPPADPATNPVVMRRLREWAPYALIAQAFSAGGLMLLVLGEPWTDAMRLIEVLLATATVASALWAARRLGAYRRELRRLSTLLLEVRLGRQTIESLSQVGQPLAELSGTCQDLARDLRLERARAVQLEGEIRQRIAGRTEALERTIGALRQQAARDGLTGLFNRRMLDACLPESIERCKAAGTPLCVLMIDIDHFKPLNDTLGHAAGDQMLRSVAQIIRSTVRETDLAFRNGGDEFVVILEDCDPQTAFIMAERLNSLGNALGRTFRLSPPPTLSIGKTMLSEVKEGTAPAMLRRADEALYEVKARHHSAVSAPPPRSRKTA